MYSTGELCLIAETTWLHFSVVQSLVCIWLIWEKRYISNALKYHISYADNFHKQAPNKLYNPI